MSTEIRKTNCHFCGYCCAFLATVEDEKVVDLKPDTSRYPYDERILAGCRRWRMNLRVLDGADRVNYPMRRVGERGSNEWERVSWDEAIADIAARLKDLAAKHGPETLSSMIGGPHTSFWPLHRFMNLFGSPNNMGIGQICWNPRIWMDALTFGWTVEADLSEQTEAFFLWGTNPAESDNSAFWRTILQFSKNSDVPLVVVDPRRTRTAAVADLWLAPRPGTDCQLALGMLNYIISEGLEDGDFVSSWCHGFEELAEHVKAYSVEKVAEICDVPADDIRKAARIFATNTTALVSGRGVDQVGRSVAPTHRAICSLRAITGNIDKPGACVIVEQSDFVPEQVLEMTDSLSEEHRSRCLNIGHTPLQSYEGFEAARKITEKLGRTLPTRYLSSAHPHLVLNAMETGEPYPVRALIVEATNPLLTYADTHRVYNALMNLDLLVVLDYFMTPTASIADYVLPAAGAIERSISQAHGGVANIVYGGSRAVAPYYERKCDYEIFRALGCALGQEEFWPEETFEEAIAMTIAPTGMTWEQYREEGFYARQPFFFKHEMSGDDCIPYGFATTTGKIELASEFLPTLGGPRLPEPGEREPMCTPKFVEEAEARGAVRMTMITGARKQPYNASMYFNDEGFRKKYPAPLAEMSQATAARLGFEEGDVLKLSTDQGEARFVLKCANMRDDLISVDYGWWHPEWQPGGPELGGIWESNVNCLTKVFLGEPMIGTWAYNDIDCMVEKVDDRLTWFDDDPAACTRLQERGEWVLPPSHRG